MEVRAQTSGIPERALEMLTRMPRQLTRMRDGRFDFALERDPLFRGFGFALN